jgi:hypothetical protein
MATVSGGGVTIFWIFEIGALNATDNQVHLASAEALKADKGGGILRRQAAKG